MRICLISREFPPDTGWGGIATFVNDLALGLAEIGHEVEVIALAADNADTATARDGITVHRVAWQGKLSEQQQLLTVMPYSHNILKQITALWQRFLICHQQKPFDLVETPEMFGEGLFVAAAKIAPLVVRLYTPHFKFIDEKFHNITASFDHQFIAMLERLTMLSADVVTSPSEDLADYVCNDIGYQRSTVPIIRDPVNTNKFCPDGPVALCDDGRLTVLFAGRLEARKGIYQLIEAVPEVISAFPNVRFVIIGRDTKTAAGNKSVAGQLKAMLKRSGAGSNVIFIPGVPNSEMPNFFRSADLCVVPSLYDNAPFTCIEALSSGIPVVATSSGGMKEYVADGKSGLIVPPGNAGALSVALIDLLKHDEKRRQFGKFAREHVLANFDRREIARQSVEVYKLARANYQASKDTALYRHDADTLMIQVNDLIGTYNRMLYDLLYAQSWRFRLSHWASMLKDRPKLTFARVIARAAMPLFKATAGNRLPGGLRRLEEAIKNKERA